MSNQNMETKCIGGHIFEYKETERNGVTVGIIKGYIATWDIDRGNDRFEPGAFSKSLDRHRKNNRPIRLKDQHGRTVGGFPIETAKEDEKGLFAIGEINLDVQQGRELYSLVKQGVLSDMSIGYGPRKKHFEKDIRVITESEVWEGSVVDEPMNPEATITSLKSVFSGLFSTPMAGMDCKWYEKEALERVGHAGYINPDRKEFPVLDEIAGTICIIPRAVIKARVELSKTGSLINTEEKEIINSLYKRMKLDAPFDTGYPKPFCLTELKNVSKSVFVNIIRHHELSKDAADYVVSAAMSNDLDTDPDDYGELNRSLDSLLEKLKS